MSEAKPEEKGENKSDLELANDWLTRETIQASERLTNAQSSIEFYKTYEPGHLASRPSYVEPGSLDATDWDIAEAEEREWPEEREKTLQNLEQEEEITGHNLQRLHLQKERVEAHNPQTIAELAALERARITKIEAGARKEKEEEEQRETVQSRLEEEADKEANPEKVEEILKWLESKSSWGSGKNLIDYTIGSPNGISKSDLKAAFLKLKPLGTANEEYDIRGYFLTALAHKVLQEGDNPEGTIELQRPNTDKYAEFREIGSGWEKGTLILIGNFGRDYGIGSDMKGGKIEVKGNVGPRAGALMNGGKLEIEGYAGYGAGFGMNGGEIQIHGKAGANVGDRMHDGLITVDKEIGPYWNEYGKTEGPNIGVYKKGGKIIVQGKEY